jgi:pyruvate dehydrogenase (quinone)
MTTVADNYVSELKASGIRRIYGIPGDSLNGFTDALRRDGEISWVHVRHEEAGAYAAEGEAATTGELAVCVGSCGPGNTHLVNGLYDANRNRIPVLAIAAHIPSAEIGSEYFQETHPTALFAECSVYTELVTSPETAQRILRMAMRAAVEEQGVAVVVIPGDIFLATVAAIGTPIPIRAAEVVARPSDDALIAAAGIIDANGPVTILAGYGARHARTEVLELAEKLQAPIVHTFRGKEWYEHDNPYDVGLTGLLGFASGYKAIVEAGTLLMLGTDFPYQQFLPEKAKIVQVDIRGRHLGRRAHLDLGLVGTVRDTAAALAGVVGTVSDTKHLEKAREHYRRTRTSLDELAVNDRNRTPLHPQFLARTIDQQANDDAIFTFDVGSVTTWAARYLTMNGSRRIYGSYNHGSMATALSNAVGAQASSPGRQTVVLAGDGGLTMMLGELFTLVQNQLPVKIVVFNNSSLNLVELEMKAAGIVNFGTDLVNPDFSAMAAGIGLYSRKVDDPDDLSEALADVLAHDGPALLDVTTARQELSIPPAIGIEQAKGFALYAIRTVLSGRGEELLDLVTTNVARRLLD